MNLDGQIAHFDPQSGSIIGIALRSITVNGLTGNNTLTLDFSSGDFLSVLNPQGVALASGVLTYDGGTGASEVLKLAGGSFTTEVDSATGANSATIQLTAGGITKTATFQSLSSVIDNASATNFTLGDSVSGDSIHVVNDPHGTESGAFALVQFANKSYVNITDASPSSGDTVSLSVPVTGTPPPAVQWQVSSKGGPFQNIPGASSPTLVFTSDLSKNGNKYQALITDSNGTRTTLAVSLTVLPKFSTQPNDLVGSPGEYATFLAAARGGTAPAATWQVRT